MPSAHQIPKYLSFWNYLLCTVYTFYNWQSAPTFVLFRHTQLVYWLFFAAKAPYLRNHVRTAAGHWLISTILQEIIGAFQIRSPTIVFYCVCLAISSGSFFLSYNCSFLTLVCMSCFNYSSPSDFKKLYASSNCVFPHSTFVTTVWLKHEKKVKLIERKCPCLLLSLFLRWLLIAKCFLHRTRGLLQAFSISVITYRATVCGAI